MPPSFSKISGKRQKKNSYKSTQGRGNYGTDFSNLPDLVHFHIYFPSCLVRIMRGLDFDFTWNLRTLVNISQNASSQGPS